MPKQKNQEFVPKTNSFYEADGNLYFVKGDGDMYKLDFDISKYLGKDMDKKKKHAIKNKNKNTSDMDKNVPLETDLTPAQVEEDYWLETSQTKLDGSTAMMETRISKCQESTGKSREECSKEVKTRMKKAGSDNTNTTDFDDKEKMEKKEDKDEAEEKKEDKDEKKDFVEICPKELDMLRKKATQLDELKKENESMKNDFQDVVGYVEKLKKERADELEGKRTDLINKITTDFNVPADEFEKDTIEEVEKSYRILNLGLKKAEAESEPTKEDMVQLTTDFDAQVAALKDRYRIKVVK